MIRYVSFVGSFYLSVRCREIIVRCVSLLVVYVQVLRKKKGLRTEVKKMFYYDGMHSFTLPPIIQCKHWVG